MGTNSPSEPVQIDTPSLASAMVSSFKILFIGRLTRIKGLDVLLRAASELRNVSVIVAGEGECRDELEQLARNLSVNASFLGRINASHRRFLLSSCDAVVIPSRVLNNGRTEGTPVVCLEAMAAGRVVIASRVGGLTEVMRDKQNGLLFDQEDVEALREKIQTVLENNDLRQNLEREAIQSSLEYSWKRIGKQYAQLIKRTLKDNGIIGDRRIEVSGVNG
jgi:glycosyltransferase involved in cell wall biosynthesis